MTATVRELAKYLADLADAGHGDRIVILSKDAEGNGYSPWSGDHSEGVYVPDTTYSGDYYGDQDLAENAADYEDYDTDGDAALVLWPIN